MHATIEVRTSDPEIVRSALQTEIESSPYTKTSTTVTVRGTTVIVTIETDDIRALRGTFNSYMNWIMAILESLSL
jgi:tRNA threonylcarbamoyladenosine modification (KEOPS) complex  Pcc1 subunit